MELLIAILLKLGFYYTPEQIQNQQINNTQTEEIIYARHIADEHLYHYDQEGGIVIEDDVDP